MLGGQSDSLRKNAMSPDFAWVLAASLGRNLIS